MDFQLLEKEIRESAKKMDRMTLSDLKNDPFVLVSYVSNGGQNISSFSFVISDAKSPYVYNESLLQTLLGDALVLTSEAVKKLPNHQVIKTRLGKTIIVNDASGGAIIVSVISNRDDSDWIAHRTELDIQAFIRKN